MIPRYRFFNEHSFQESGFCYKEPLTIALYIFCVKNIKIARIRGRFLYWWRCGSRSRFAKCFAPSVVLLEASSLGIPLEPPNNEEEYIQKDPFGSNCETRWRCGKSNPSPNSVSEKSLRRIVLILFLVGCEESERNHSYHIPWFKICAREARRFDPKDIFCPDSPPQEPRLVDIARRWRLGFRERERKIVHRKIR